MAFSPLFGKSGKNIAIKRNFAGRPKSLFGAEVPRGIFDVRITPMPDTPGVLSRVEWLTVDDYERLEHETVTPRHFDLQSEGDIDGVIVAMKLSC